VPDPRTTITELVTGLGMLGHADVASAITARPAAMASVSPALWADLDRWSRSPTFSHEFVAAFRNGQAFLDAPAALRGRVPVLIDWRGNTKPVDDDLVPADLRIDHVYLVSCKYLSRILGNAAPARLFDGLLRIRMSAERTSWFETVAPAELASLTRAATLHAGLEPADHVSHLGGPALQQLIDSLRGGSWPESCADRWRELVDVVSERSAERWRAAIGTRQDSVRLLWRLLRIGPTPYFILGVGDKGPLRLRILTSWDWSYRYRLEDLEVSAGSGGQPLVRWSAHVRDRDHGRIDEVRGHIEVRWSHGRMKGVPEAKIYLDTPHAHVPGYLPLDEPHLR
jgi:hypothetical protein